MKHHAIALAVLATTAIVPIGSLRADTSGHAPGHPPVHQPPARLGAIVTVEPRSFNGTCPATITFTGDITRSDDGRQADQDVAYTWLRSDGAQGPIFHAQLRAKQLLQVRTTWQLDGPPRSHYAGWQAIRVWWPSDEAGSAITSWHAPFDLACR